jgi:hypothetical protein
VEDIQPAQRVEEELTHPTPMLHNPHASSKGAGQRKGNTRNKQNITSKVHPKLKNQSSANPTTASYTKSY